jgi:hypothetical protein
MTNAEQKAKSILEERLEGRATVAFVNEEGDRIAIEITSPFSSYAWTAAALEKACGLIGQATNCAIEVRLAAYRPNK